MFTVYCFFCVSIVTSHQICNVVLVLALEPLRPHTLASSCICSAQSVILHNLLIDRMAANLQIGAQSVDHMYSTYVAQSANRAEAPRQL